MNYEMYPWLDKFSLSWCLDPLVDHPSFVAKRMFGGGAIYYEGLLVLLFTESPGDREWRGVKYDFDIWNGLLIPSRKERHQKLMTDLPDLKVHPVLHSWLFLPMDTEDLEEVVQKIVKRIKVVDPLFGVIPGQKKSTKKNRNNKPKPRKRRKSKPSTASSTTKPSSKKYAGDRLFEKLQD